MNSFDEQVVKLNCRVKLRIAPSPIHGVGIFAITDILKGDKLYADAMPEVYTIPYSAFSKLFPEARQQLLERWPLVTTGSRFIFPDARQLAYMNHSETPNYDAVADVALADIKAGEEVTEDYRRIEGYETVFPWLAVDIPRKKKA